MLSTDNDGYFRPYPVAGTTVDQEGWTELAKDGLGVAGVWVLSRLGEKAEINGRYREEQYRYIYTVHVLLPTWPKYGR